MAEGVTTIGQTGLYGFATSTGLPSTIPLTSRQIRKSAVLNITGGSDYSTRSDPAIFDDLSKGYVTSGNILDEADSQRTYSGYLKGTRPPPSLKYVLDYFIPGGDPDSPYAVPLNQESYNDFTSRMYELFLRSKIPGSVSFDQASYDDVHTILMSNSKVALRAHRFPLLRGSHLRAQRFVRPGLPNSSFSPYDRPVKNPYTPTVGDVQYVGNPTGKPDGERTMFTLSPSSKKQAQAAKSS